MVPYKHYTEDVISDAVSDRLDPDTVNDAPSPVTVRRWKRWVRLNSADIDGQLRSIAHRGLDFSKELLRSGVSLLKELIRSIPNGWLRAILHTLYNSGGRMVPVYT